MRWKKKRVPATGSKQMDAWFFEDYIVSQNRNYFDAGPHGRVSAQWWFELTRIVREKVEEREVWIGDAPTFAELERVVALDKYRRELWMIFLNAARSTS